MRTSQATHFRHLGTAVAFIAVMTALWPNIISMAGAGGSAPPTPAVGSKNETPATKPDYGVGSFAAFPPDSSSKNHVSQGAAEPSTGTSTSSAPDASPKNNSGETGAALDATVANLAASGSLITCGASGNMTWTTTSSSYAVIRECTLSVAQDGWVFISANGSVGRRDGAYEAQFEIGVGSAIGDPDIDRWVNVYDDSRDGSDRSVALSTLEPVTAGMHTFYFLGKRYSGAGTVLLYDPVLAAIFIPGADSGVLACGASGNMDWTTTSSGFAVIRKCILSVPRDGWVFFSADGSVGRRDGEYEVQFEIGVDSTSGDPNVDRWVNVYDDTGDGTDESVALSVLVPVTAGAHTFYSLGKRYNGAGTVLVYDPTLTVIYVPSPSVTALACGASGNMNWATTSTSFVVIRKCTLAVPQAGWVFISADGSVGRRDGQYEAQFEIGIDSTGGDPNIDRWVNVYDDSGDGTDESVALSVLKQIPAGRHTFYFLGRRYSGAATVLVYDPTLTIIAPAGRAYLPLVVRRD